MGSTRRIITPLSPIVMEEGSELGGYHLNTADHMIFSVYSEHLHRNDVTHLDGDVSNDVVWKCHCWRI